MGGGRFEKDPAKWPPCSSDRGDMKVWYEWAHVHMADSGQPYRRIVALNDIVHHQREALGNPLSTSASKGLVFDMEFMEFFAAKRHPGTTYAGISYKGEKLKNVCELPNGGVDIQSVPVFWTLPCGQTVFLPLFDFKAAREDQLKPGDIFEAYYSHGVAMHWDPLGMPEDEAAFDAWR